MICAELVYPNIMMLFSPSIFEIDTLQLAMF